MDSFIKILEISIWPALVLICVYIFKRELTKVLGRLTEVEVAGGKLRLDKELEAVEIIEMEEPNNDIESKSWAEQLQTIATLNPRAAILEAWTGIEVACYEAGLTMGATMKRFSPKALEDFLLNSGEFDSKMVGNVHELRMIRNKVAHNPNVSLEYVDASKYITFSNATITAIKSNTR